MAISINKVEREAPELLTLSKAASDAVRSNRLGGQKAKVALALDFSGSMRKRYQSGAMQRLVEKVLALATQLDDDGAIDLFVFDTDADYLGEVTLENFRGFIAKVTDGRHMGTTNYHDLFKGVLDHYDLTPQRNIVAGGGLVGDTRKFDEYAPLSSPINEPVLAIFLTDGSPDSKTKAVKELVTASYAPVFWQFLSIGSESIKFLEKLDDEVKGRYIDNADYKPVGDVDKLTGDELYSMVLDEFPDWVIEERKRGQIR